LRQNRPPTTAAAVITTAYSLLPGRYRPPAATRAIRAPAEAAPRAPTR